MNSTEKESIISMLGVYREEWKYRDELFEKTFWRFTYLSLIIGFFPNLLEKFQLSGKIPLLALSPVVFAITGIIIAFFGFFVALNGMKRIEKLDDIYYRLIEKLPDEYHIEHIAQEKEPGQKKEKKIFRVRTNYLFCAIYVFVVLLIALNCIMGL